MSIPASFVGLTYVDFARPDLVRARLTYVVLLPVGYGLLIHEKTRRVAGHNPRSPDLVAGSGRINPRSTDLVAGSPVDNSRPPVFIRSDNKNRSRGIDTMPMSVVGLP